MASQSKLDPLIGGDVSDLRRHFQEIFRAVQANYCAALEQLEPEATFKSDEWTRSEEKVIKKGFGLTRVLRDSAVFEQAVVALSSVSGILPTALSEKLIGASEPAPFCADGVSLIVHPHSPMAPTTHANVRLLTVGDKTWFGGGADLTPYYLFEEDAIAFHRRLFQLCEETRPGSYQAFKEWCDSYFYLPHRGEARGIGGIFYDYLGRDSLGDLRDGAALTERLGFGLASCYIPIVEKRKDMPWGDAHRTFQEIRRGRYVEFNLMYDRGTQFGLQSGGRVESILASLPPRVQWSYGFVPEPGSEEEKLIETLRNSRNWLADKREC
jgi:coproporphyrinogen III oxidase